MTLRSHDHAEEGRGLPRNQRTVMACLDAERRPLTAYQILDRVREAGISHPPTVYRALNELIRAGLVHRVESLSGFVACRHGGHGHRAAFAICRACRKVEEVELTAEGLPEVGAFAPAGFAVERVSLEFEGLCEACARGAAQHPG
jgi:Fur family zinc uptake transcriptional regulator